MYSKEEVKMFMQAQFGLVIDIDRLAEEAVQLYLDELDYELISSEFVKNLPDPVIFQNYLYTDETEWIIGIALEAETNNPLFLVCLKDGVRVYEKLLSEGEM
jgi:hypothetical protein